MNGMRRWGVAVATVMLSAAGAGEVRSQSVVRDSDRDVRLERADLLVDQAMVIASQKRDFATASSLLQEAAALRGTDKGAVDALIKAGHFSWYGGRGLNAISAFRRAGETALALGDRTGAADAFMNGAWVAAQEGEWATARELAARGQAHGATTVVAALDTPIGG